MKHNVIKHFILASLLILILSGSSYSYPVSYWTADGVAVCTVAGEQTFPYTVMVSSSESIIVWADYRSGNWDIYAQKLYGNGDTQWATNGVTISAYQTSNQNFPQAVSDGYGGAIVVWEDTRNGIWNLYAQRINANGIPQWTPNGIPVAPSSGDQLYYTANQGYPAIVSDGSGGAVITWMDYRSGSYDIMAQKLNGSGVQQWGSSGVIVCSAAGDQYYPTLVTDGLGGAIITWYDARVGNNNVYAQRINSIGNVAWTTNGVPVCAMTGDQAYPSIASDGVGGAVFSWQDFRYGNWDIFAQRINGNGAPQWTADGIWVCAAGNPQIYPKIVSDNLGGGVIVWSDNRTGFPGYYDLYVQRVSGSGINLWAVYGNLIPSSSQQTTPMPVSDGSSGMTLAWNQNSNITAQQVDGNGSNLWGTNGLQVCQAANDQYRQHMAKYGPRGAVVAWSDYRNSDYDIYAQRIGESSTEIYVATTGSNTSGAGTIDLPYQTISFALTKAVSGCAIYAAPGVYYEHDIRWSKNNDVSLIGSGSNETIISGEAINRVISVESALMLSLKGLTIKDGYANAINGGGIFLPSGSSLNLTKVNFMGNRAYDAALSKGNGGAIYSNGNVMISAADCLFAGNYASYNGSVIHYATFESINCDFHDNTAEYAGGVLYGVYWTASKCIVYNNSAPNSNGAVTSGLPYHRANVMDSIFHDNTSWNGAISNNCNWSVSNSIFYRNSVTGFSSASIAYGGAWTVTNCAFSDNSAPSSMYGLFYNVNPFIATNCSFIRNTSANSSVLGSVFGVAIKNAIIWDCPNPFMTVSGTIKYSDVQGGAAVYGGLSDGGGNINIDPKLISTEGGDPQYLQLGTGSPCIDSGTLEAGVPQTDAAGKPRSGGYGVDMGLYEYSGPSIRVAQPNGGEHISRGSQYSIVYNITPQANNVNIRLSTDKGLTWGFLLTSEAYTHSGVCTFEWVPMPAHVSTECLISIEGTEPVSGIWNYDVSNATFEIISVPDTISPIVTVESPGGWITLDAGTSYEVRWLAVDETTFPVSKYISIYYTTSEGNDGWIAITTVESNNRTATSGAYVWNIPEDVLLPDVSAIARISVEARDTSNNKGYDASDQFNLKAVPSTIYVSMTGSDETGNGTSAKPYKTVQKGLNKVATGMLVSVEAGVYREHDIKWPTKQNIILRGAGSNETIISGESISRIISVESAVRLNIESLMITDSQSNNLDGGGVFLCSGASMNLKKAYFKDNKVGYHELSPAGRGGAIYAVGATVSAEGCLFRGNRGGKYYNEYVFAGVGYGGDWQIDNCIFDANITRAYGGVFSNVGTVKASNCLFVTNEAGGGGVVHQGSMEATNCTFINNRAGEGAVGYSADIKATNCIFSKNVCLAQFGGVARYGTWDITNCTFNNNVAQWGQAASAGINWTIKNSIFWGGDDPWGGNSQFDGMTGTIKYSDVRNRSWGGLTTTECISADPRFISKESTDPNFLRLGSGTLCIDRASKEAPSLDYAGNPRPHGFANDMGVFEFQGPSVKVVQPNGGESINASVTYEVEWSVSPEADDVYVRFSRDRGATWNMVVTHETLTRSGLCTFEWVPDKMLSSTECLISVEALDNGYWNCDTSDAKFTIIEMTAPVVTVEAPSGWITLEAGTSYEVRWSATDDTALPVSGYISIYYTTNEAGGIWIALTTEAYNNLTATSGAYTWNIPDTIVPTNSLINARISVEARDTSNNKGFDISDMFDLIGLRSLVYVSKTGSDVTGDGTILKPFATIAKGLQRIAVSGSVEVAAGTYLEHNILWPDRNNIKLHGAGTSNTIISAEALGRFIFVGSAVNITIESMTIKDGRAELITYGGGAIKLAFGSRLDLKGVDFIGNKTVANAAGAIWSVNSSVFASNCRFISNESIQSGGIGSGGVLWGGIWNASDCLFLSNTAGVYGGVALNASMILTRCTFESNSAGYGGGGVAHDSYFTVTNCVFIGNSCGQGGVSKGGSWSVADSIFYGNIGNYGGIFNGSYWDIVNCTFYNNTANNDGSIGYGSSLKAKNCIFWGTNDPFSGMVSGTLEYCDVQGADWDVLRTVECVSANPRFASTVSTDPSFLRLGAGSPCIDSASSEAPTPDLAGYVRPHGLGNDMGVYEFQGPSIRVKYPNGGEIFTYHVTYETYVNITWEVSDQPENDMPALPLKINFSMNNGSSWSSVTPETDAVPPYTIAVPLVLSKYCLISIEAVDNSAHSNYDTSNGTFEITIDDPFPPIVTIEAPVTGEAIKGGSVYQVKWKASDNVLVQPGTTTIEVSLNNGASWSVVTSEMTTSPYFWTVNSANTTEAKVRIRMRDIAGNTGVATSGAFVIDSTSPEVLTTSPTNGATAVIQDTDIVITFSETMEISTVVVTMEPKVGWVKTWDPSNKQVTFNPTINLVEGVLYTVTVEAGAKDMVGNTMVSLYRFNFRIRDITAPTVTVLRPATGEALRGRSQYLITWEATDNVGIKTSSTTLEVSINNGATWANIVSWQNASPYIWTVTAETTTEAKIKVTAQDTSGNVASGISGKFKIDSTSPEVIATDPLNGAKNISPTANIAITFSETMETSTVVVTMEPKVGWVRSWNASNTLVTLNPVSSLTEGQLYRVTVEAGAKDMVGNTMFSPYSFTFEVSDLSPPTVTVLRPATGEALRGGSQYLITWEATDNVTIKPNSTTIEVSLNNGATWENIASGVNTSPYNWTVSPVNTTEARVRVMASDNEGNIGTGTGGKFTIDSTSPEVLYTSPINGARGVPVDSNIIITFSETMETSTVVVTMEPKAGWVKSWNASGKQVTFDPVADLVQGKIIRVTVEAGAKDIAGNIMVSPYVFTFEAGDVNAPLVTVESPNGGEFLSSGFDYAINWKATDESGIKATGITLSYSINSGSTWTPIVSGLSNTGSYLWHTPHVSSGNCRVLVEAEDNLGFIGSDMSNGDFTITSPGAPTIEVTINGKRFISGDLLPPYRTNMAGLTIYASSPVSDAKMFVDGSQVVLNKVQDVPPAYMGTFSIMPNPVNPMHILNFYASDEVGSATTLTLEAQVLSGGVQVVGVPLNYPNPFKPLSGGTTKIQYSLSTYASVTIVLYDITGQEVKRWEFASGEQGGKAGINTVEWDGKSLFGEVVGNGMYIYRILSEGKTIGTGKLVILD